MRSQFIPQDGYNLTATVPPADGLPGVKFTYRKATGPARRRFQNAAPGAEEETAGKLFLDQVHNQTVTFFTIDAAGIEQAQPTAKLTAAQFNQLDPDLWSAVINRVLGYAAPDAEGN